MERELVVHQGIIADSKSDWKKQVASLQKLRQLAESGGSDAQNALLQVMPALSHHLAALVGNLRSSLVRECCECVGAFSGCLGSKFSTVACDALVPPLLRASIVTIAIISTSAKEALRAMLIHGAAGITAKTAIHLADTVTTLGDKSHHVSRAAAAMALSYLLVDEFICKQPEKVLAGIEKAIHIGCMDPAELVRDRSRSNWRQLDAINPVRAAGVLDHMPEHIQALILQEKSYEYAALQNENRDKSRKAGTSPKDKTSPTFRELPFEHTTSVREKVVVPPRRGPRRASLAIITGPHQALFSEYSSTQAEEKAILPNEAHAYPLNSFGSPPLQSKNATPEQNGRSSASAQFDASHKHPSAPRRAKQVSPSQRPPLPQEAKSQNAKITGTYRNEPNPFAKRPPRRSVAIGMTGPLLKPLSSTSTQKALQSEDTRSSNQHTLPSKQVDGPAVDSRAEAFDRNCGNTEVARDCDQQHNESESLPHEDTADRGEEVASNAFTADVQKEPCISSGNPSTPRTSDNSSESTLQSTNGNQNSPCDDTNAKNDHGSQQSKGQIVPVEKHAMLQQSPSQIFSPTSSSNLSDTPCSKNSTPVDKELYAESSTGSTASDTFCQDGEKTPCLANTPKTPENQSQVTCGESSGINNIPEALREIIFPPTPEAVRVASRKTRISFILNPADLSSPQAISAPGGSQAQAPVTVARRTKHILQKQDVNRANHSERSEIQLDDERDRDAVATLLNIAECAPPAKNHCVVNQSGHLLPTDEHSITKTRTDSTFVATENVKFAITGEQKENNFSSTNQEEDDRDSRCTERQESAETRNALLEEPLDRFSSNIARTRGQPQPISSNRTTSGRGKPPAQQRRTYGAKNFVANKSSGTSSADPKTSLSKKLMDGLRLIEMSRKSGTVVGPRQSSSVWEKRVDALKNFQEALQTCVQDPQFHFPEVFDIKFATRVIGLLFEMASDAHNRVVSAALDAFFYLLLCVEVPSCDTKDSNPLQLALERRPDAMMRILTLLGDTKENIRIAATRVMQSMVVQFRPETRVLLIVQAVSSVHAVRGKRGSTNTARGLTAAHSPKSAIVGCEQLLEAFRSAAASGEGFVWQPVSLLRSLLMAMASLLRDRRADVRTAAVPVVQAVYESLPPEAMQLVLADSRFDAAEVKALRDALGSRVTLPSSSSRTPVSSKPAVHSR